VSDGDERRSAASILAELDGLAGSLLDLTVVLSGSRVPRAERRVSLLQRLASLIAGVLASDSWLEERITMLHRRVGAAVAVVSVGGSEFTVQYEVTALDMIEAMVLHDLAFSEGARQAFKEAVLDMLEDTVVATAGGRVTLREYFERRGVPWERARRHLEREIVALLNALRRELEAYERPEPGRSVRGERIAYYKYVRERLAAGNPLWAAVLGALTMSVSYAVGVALASRPPIGGARGLAAAVDRDATLLRALEELVREPPDRLVSSILESGDPLEAYARHRRRLEEALDEALRRAGTRRLNVKLRIPLAPADLRVVEERVARGGDRVLDVSTGRRRLSQAQ